MTFRQLDWECDYSFFVACREAFGVPFNKGRELLTDDAVATYCMGGEL